MNSHVAKPSPRSPLKFGWAMADGSMKPVYFEGPMSSEFLQDLICTCKGKMLVANHVFVQNKV
jgi:hypothetical protein